MNKLFIFSLVLGLMACGHTRKSDSAEIRLSGAGATFPLPYYNLAFRTWQDSTGIPVTYGGIGSGGGIRSLKDGVVDFGGSDVFLSDEEMQAVPGGVVQIPSCLGAVVLSYRLPGNPELKLTGSLVAGIYLGQITRWNDPRLLEANPGLSLPDLPILPFYRSDGSGTTFVFTDYLSKVCEEWKEKVGAGKSLKWPSGIAAKGNPGIAGAVSQTEGSIGYIGSEYAFSLHLPMASLENPSGRWVAPTADGIAAAAIDLPADVRTMLTASPHPDAYPISCFTWLLVRREQAYAGRTRTQAAAVVELLQWMVGPEAQALTEKVHYTPLPSSVVGQAKELLKSVNYQGEPLFN